MSAAVGSGCNPEPTESIPLGLTGSLHEAGSDVGDGPADLASSEDQPAPESRAAFSGLLRPEGGDSSDSDSWRSFELPPKGTALGVTNTSSIGLLLDQA